MAVELVACASLVDIQRYQGAYLNSAARARVLADVYSEAFSGAGLAARVVKRRARGDGEPLKVLFVTFQVCDGQAAAASLARWVELLPPSRFATAVLSVDELVERRPALGVVARGGKRSEDVGAGLMERMRGVCAGGVHVLPPDGDWLAAVRRGVVVADGFAPDIAVFVGSPACPVQAGMAFRRVAPVQLNMNIGVPLPISGMDGVVYHNGVRAAEDAAALAGMGIAQHRVVTIGSDLRSCLTVRPASRAVLGLPEGAVVLANAASLIAKRMLYDGFIDGLTACLRANRGVWWMGIGGGETGVLEERLKEAGVGDRCVLTGPVSDPRPVMAAADVLLNEYPEGGGNTVLEAMGVGTPVAAVYAGRRHAECIGAILAGEHAVGGNDRAAYWRLVQRWIDDAGERRRVGEAMKRLAHAEYDYAGIVRRYAAIFEEAAGADGR
jgi:hypothetical protein